MKELESAGFLLVILIYSRQAFMKFCLKKLFITTSLLLLHACTEGETTEIYEFVRAADLGIETIHVVKEHDDNLRAGRELRVKAIAKLKSGDELDISKDVRWFSSNPAILTVKEDGLFLAREAAETVVVPFRVEFAGLKVVSEATVSVAKLKSLELGIAKKGMDAQCQIASDEFEMSQCSAKRLCVLGEYENEAAKREETLYVALTTSSDSLLKEGYVINARVDMSEGGLDESMSVKLDKITSNTLYISHIANLDSLTISMPSNKLTMGKKLDFTVNVPERIKPYIKWHAEDFDLGQPEVDVTINGGRLSAFFENDFVNDWENYGVNITASCSGFVSESKAVLIESDVHIIKITDNLTSHDLLIGGEDPVELGLEAKSKEGGLLTIRNGDVSWYVCPLAQSVCLAGDKMDDNGSTLSLTVGHEVEPKDIRIEAVFHGRKASREDFRFVE